MLNVFLSKDSTGTQASFRISGTVLRKADEPLDGEFVMGSDAVYPLCIEDTFPIFGCQVPSLVSDPLRLSYETIMGGEKIDWHKALGTARFAKMLKRLYATVHDDATQIVNHRYIPHLQESRKVLGKLQPSLIDEEALKKALSQGNTAFAESFMPTADGFTKKVRYSHATTTGRLTVRSGPKILNLNKEHRNILRSRFKKGAIGIIDFVSLEPRTALLLTRGEAPFDIYEAMRSELGSQHTRAQLKVATISALYGQRGETSIPQSVISRFFGLPEIHRRHLGGETYGNLYGRPLSSGDERLRLPHFVQSTAVDVALKGFGKLCDTYREMVPLFIIHDAIVVDAERDLLQKLGKTGLEIDIEPLGKFYLTVKMIDEDNS